VVAPGWIPAVNFGKKLYRSGKDGVIFLTISGGNPEKGEVNPLISAFTGS
jgi:hypothetical protein